MAVNPLATSPPRRVLFKTSENVRKKTKNNRMKKTIIQKAVGGILYIK